MYTLGILRVDINSRVPVEDLGEALPDLLSLFPSRSLNIPARIETST